MPRAIDAASANQLSVIGEQRWQHALFTTFTLNLSFFEAYVLPMLQRAHCDDITVLVDETFYLESMAESSARGVGTWYRVLPVAMSNGVFHAKLTYLSDERENDVLMVGSGNVTWAGFGHQLECLDVIRATTNGAAFRDFAGLLKSLLNSEKARLGSAQRWIEAVAERAARIGAASTDAATSIRLIASIPTSISDQVVDALASSGPFDRVVAMSPFHSPDAGPLLRCAERLGIGDVCVVVDGKTGTTAVHGGVKGVSFAMREAEGDRRPTHAKWFEFLGRTPWLLTGSVNATQSSFETTANFEVASLRRAAPTMLGKWKECTPVGTGVLPPDIVSLGGRRAISGTLESAELIRGAFLRPSSINDGVWDVVLVQKGVESPLSPVEVLHSEFVIRLPHGIEVDEGEPIQLKLSKEGVIALGWLMFEAELQLSSDEREFHRRIRRLRGEHAEGADFINIIGWLAERVSDLALSTRSSKATTSLAAEKSGERPTAPFEYNRWLRGALAGTAHPNAALGACRIAFNALERYAARTLIAHTSPRVEPDFPSHFGPGESSDESDDLVSEARGAATSQSLETLQRNLEHMLKSENVDHNTVRFLLEAMLWVLIVRDQVRERREAGIDSLPFTQWGYFAKAHLIKNPNDVFLATLVLTAMSCAFAFRTASEPRTDSFAALARRAASALIEVEPASAIDATLRSMPSFAFLTEEQLKVAVAAMPELLRWQGVSDELRRFLVDWTRARGNLAFPPSLLQSTGGVLAELRHRRGMTPPYVEWTDTVPERCSVQCGHRFDRSDMAVLRNWRIIKCIRCGMIHVWMGDSF